MLGGKGRERGALSKGGAQAVMKAHTWVGRRGPWVQLWLSAEEGCRPVIGHCWLQLDAGEGVPEERGESQCRQVL